MIDKYIEILERPMWEPYPQWKEVTPSDIPQIAQELHALRYEIVKEALREYDLDDAFHLRANVWSKNTVAHVRSWINGKMEG